MIGRLLTNKDLEHGVAGGRGKRLKTNSSFCFRDGEYNKNNVTEHLVLSLEVFQLLVDKSKLRDLIAKIGVACQGMEGSKYGNAVTDHEVARIRLPGSCVCLILSVSLYR